MRAERPAGAGRARSFLADTTALVVFFTLTGIVNERLVVGMSWQEVATSRGIGAPLMVLTARPYGLYRDRLLGLRPGGSRARRAALDAFALMSFQVPIYAAIIWSAGADAAGLVRGTIAAALMMLCLGRPYSLWLDLVRRRFGLPAGGERPMSLQE